MRTLVLFVLSCGLLAASNAWGQLGPLDPNARLPRHAMWGWGEVPKEPGSTLPDSNLPATRLSTGRTESRLRTFSLMPLQRGALQQLPEGRLHDHHLPNEKLGPEPEAGSRLPASTLGLGRGFSHGSLYGPPGPRQSARFAVPIDATTRLPHRYP